MTLIARHQHDVLHRSTRHVAVDTILPKGLFADSFECAALARLMAFHAAIGEELHVAAFELMRVVAVGTVHGLRLLEALALLQARKL